MKNKEKVSKDFVEFVWDMGGEEAIKETFVFKITKCVICGEERGKKTVPMPKTGCEHLNEFFVNKFLSIQEFIVVRSGSALYENLYKDRNVRFYLSAMAKIKIIWYDNEIEMYYK